ncbi:shikimate dehydrogenase [Synechocystis sp. LKSZ1]|uniref:shikimate dehydrogenase n=1 Tax=Synechocystis sp. LKSZ1 TaxID=3144951 RepID=UPI00336BE493
MPTITGKTKLLGVIGHPVSHSLSPLMQNAAITALGIDWVYVAWPIHPTELTMAVAGLAAIGVQGFNITIPHKQAIIPLLQQLTPVAQQVGAVNTVWRTEAGWHGTNTDVAGFISPLQALNQNWSSVTPVVLGNGGAARAIVVGLAQLGCPCIQVVGRDLDKLTVFKTSWPDPALEKLLEVYGWDALERLIPATQLLVNTTPIGMAPDVTASPVSDELMKTLSPQAIVYDLIYTPRPTHFLQQAKRQGAITLDGLEMLVQQGAAALEIWTGQAAPVAVMREALQTYLE